ncbi:MAG: XRE family transcriptional regulator [Methanocorpusculum sp.]|uniref:helix-turn-helix domain-containing protein n=1 Tax=Methanocorpusculum sp. TaxID=2058474 RepID=UPI002718D29A|nr:XRE family transcriptional regulator [Methanocorpusculum sp.]MDO9522230.1 XRE family transcriptional regulator [Methanocorpusculum sp.]
MFGERLKQARKLARLTQEQLGERVSVEKMTISKYEAGKISPSSSTLISLSRVLDVDIDYFFRETSVVLASTPQFRLADPKEKLPKKEEKQIIARTQELLEKYLEIMAIMDIPSVEVDYAHLKWDVNFFHEDIEALTFEVRKEWELGLDPIDNLMSTAEDNGFKIMLVDGPDNFEAVTFPNESIGPVIVLRKNAPKERQRFSLAHELGHYFVNRGWCNAEAAANRFAAALLAPKQMLMKDTGVHRTDFTKEELLLLREKYGMSVFALLVRMESLNIIDEKTKKKLMKADREKRWSVRSNGEAYLHTEEPKRMELLVRRAVSEGIISTSKGRELLGEQISFTSLSGEAA